MNSLDKQIRAKRSLGQNFLIDRTVIDRIVSNLGNVEGEKIIEIGPGQGALTAILLDSGAQVTAIEIDKELIPLLNNEFADSGRFQCVEADILQTDLSDLVPKSPIKLVGNLPYYISTAILQKLVEQKELFSLIVLMLQKEVVERITAVPGDSSRGFLTVLIEDAFTSELAFDVPPSAFMPVPKVWSSVVLLRPKTSEIIDKINFRRLLSMSFAQKRKTILNNLKNEYKNADRSLLEAGIDPKRRAETITMGEWARLTRVICR